MFQTEDEMRTVLGTNMGRYNGIVACFNSDPVAFDPKFWEGPEDEVIESPQGGGYGSLRLMGSCGSTQAFERRMSRSMSFLHVSESLLAAP